jgi:hypothetical protein
VKAREPAVHHLERYLARMFGDNQLVEVRLIGAGPVRTGMFDDVERMRHEVRRHWEAGNFYASLNRPRWQRANNRLRVTREALRDQDIAAITRIPFDFDSVRPKDVPADLPELKAAERQRDALVDYLRGHGWPAPTLAMSGNGFHAQYRTRLDLTDATSSAFVRRLMDRLYLRLKHRFQLPRVHFDAAVRNPSRVFRLYGTVNRKGTERPGRLHRRSSVWTPDTWEDVSVDRIQAVCAALERYAPSSEQSMPRTSVDSELDVVAYFEEKGLYRRPLGEWHGLERHAVRCPWEHEHSESTHRYDTSTVVFVSEAGWPAFHCSHAHCAERHLADVLEALG